MEVIAVFADFLTFAFSHSWKWFPLQTQRTLLTIFVEVSYAFFSKIFLVADFSFKITKF